MKTPCFIAILFAFGLATVFFLACPLFKSVEIPQNGELGNRAEMTIHDSLATSAAERDIDFSEPRRIPLGTTTLPADIKQALSVVSSISERLRWKDAEMVEITETDTEIIVVWPSRHEGLDTRHADYEARAVVDKITFAIVSLKRGS